MAVSHPKADWASGLSRRPLLARGHPLRPRSRRALPGGAPATRLGGRALTRLTRRGPRARVRVPAVRAVLLHAHVVRISRRRYRRRPTTSRTRSVVEVRGSSTSTATPTTATERKPPTTFHRPERSASAVAAGRVPPNMSARAGSARASGTCGGRTTRATPVVGGAPSRGCSGAAGPSTPRRDEAAPLAPHGALALERRRDAGRLRRLGDGDAWVAADVREKLPQGSQTMKSSSGRSNRRRRMRRLRLLPSSDPV